MKVTSVTHTLPPNELADALASIVHILETNGYSTKGVDFTDIIARKLSDDFVRTLTDRGVRVKNHSWELKPDGCLRVKLYLPYKDDLAFMPELLNSSGE